jgi:hypothetical protein
LRSSFLKRLVEVVRLNPKNPVAAWAGMRAVLGDGDATRKKETTLLAALAATHRTQTEHVIPFEGDVCMADGCGYVFVAIRAETFDGTSTGGVDLCLVILAAEVWRVSYLWFTVEF